MKNWVGDCHRESSAASVMTERSRWCVRRLLWRSGSDLTERSAATWLFCCTTWNVGGETVSGETFSTCWGDDRAERYHSRAPHQATAAISSAAETASSGLLR